MISSRHRMKEVRLGKPALRFFGRLRRCAWMGCVAFLALACSPRTDPPDAGRTGTVVDPDANSERITPGDPGPVSGDCTSLVQKTCGETCAQSPACKAAELLREFAPEQCGEALESPVTYPACALNFCESLLLKTCGDVGNLDDAPCANTSGCKTARRIVEHKEDGGVVFREDEYILSSCLQALEDEVIFFPCHPDDDV